MSSAAVISNKHIGGQFFRMSLEWKSSAVVPGQFVMVRISDSMDPFLRRPFCIYDAGKGTVGILYKVVGRGTAVLSTLSREDRVDLLGPLGNGFPSPGKGGSLIMVAGGIGIAPFYLLARNLGRGKKGAKLFYGAKNSVEARLAGDFKKTALEVNVATEDGSVGKKGMVTDMLDDGLNEDSVIYACGPSGMLKGVSEIAEKRGIRCFVSLERAMACGMGVCLGCAVRMQGHKAGFLRYKMVCSDGPVFDSEDIEWEAF